MSQYFEIRIFNEDDTKPVLNLISDIIVNEFKFKLEFNSLDSDLLYIEEHYNKGNHGCFWVAEFIDVITNKQQIVGTAAIRNMKDKFDYTCELKRMYVSKKFRRLGIGQKLLDVAIDFAESVGYLRIILDSSKELKAARKMYLKKGFVDIPRYNDNYRADIFMERKLKSP